MASTRFGWVGIVFLVILLGGHVNKSAAQIGERITQCKKSVRVYFVEDKSVWEDVEPSRFPDNMIVADITGNSMYKIFVNGVPIWIRSAECKVSRSTQPANPQSAARQMEGASRGFGD